VATSRSVPRSNCPATGPRGVRESRSCAPGPLRAQPITREARRVGEQGARSALRTSQKAGSLSDSNLVAEVVSPFTAWPRCVQAHTPQASRAWGVAGAAARVSAGAGGARLVCAHHGRLVVIRGRVGAASDAPIQPAVAALPREILRACYARAREHLRCFVHRLARWGALRRQREWRVAPPPLPTVPLTAPTTAASGTSNGSGGDGRQMARA